MTKKIRIIYLSMILVPLLLSGQNMEGPIRSISYDLDVETIDRYFKNPPNIYRVIQYQMNRMDPMTDAELASHIRELVSYGIGGTQLSVVNNNRYLEDPEAWQRFQRNVDAVKKAGLRVWIHDEKGYPSGAAGGVTVKGHPELENRGLLRIIQKGEGKETVMLSVPSDVHFLRAVLTPRVNGKLDRTQSREVPLTDSVVICQTPMGEWQLSLFGTRILDKNTQAQSTMAQFKQSGHYPAWLDPASGRRFIDVTYQAYANHLTDLADKIDVFYTGESHLMTMHWRHSSMKNGPVGDYAYLPWADNFPKDFERMFGYDLMPCLDALFEGDDEISKTIRLNYFQAIARLYADNYAGAINTWCKEHQVKSFFHPLLEEYMAIQTICYGDMIRALRQAAIPACDIPVPKFNATNWEFWMPKYISSAAVIDGKVTVGGLLDPIIGGNGRNDLSPTFDRLTRTMNMAFLCGINQISTYIPYAPYGYDEYRRFNEYVGRLAVMLRGAKNTAEVALYYPIETFQANFKATAKFWPEIKADFQSYQEVTDRLASSFLKMGVDFNFLPADGILTGILSDGKLKVGENNYRAIVMPKTEVLSLTVLKRLLTCEEAGIKVFWIDTLPSMGCSTEEHTEVRKLTERLQLTADPVPTLCEMKNEHFDLQMEILSGSIMQGRFLRDGRQIYFLTNDTGETAKYLMKGTGEGTLYNPMNGQIKRIRFPFEEKLPAYRGIFIAKE